MPNEEIYKELKEIGKRLIQLAEENSVEEESEDQEYDNESGEMKSMKGMANKGDKMQLARALFSKG